MAEHTADAEPGRRDDHDVDPRWRPSPTKVVVGIILLVAIVVPLWVGSYARVEPRLFGFPFFYWYQLAWVFLAAIACAIAFALLRAERRRFERSATTGRRADPTPGSEQSGGER